MRRIFDLCWFTFAPKALLFLSLYKKLASLSAGLKWLHIVQRGVVKEYGQCVHNNITRSPMDKQVEHLERDGQKHSGIYL